MLLECLNGQPITVNKSPLIDNVRLNIDNENHQARFKMLYVKDDKNIPIDIIVFNYTLPKLAVNNGGVSVTLSGIEQNKNVQFKITVTYAFFKKKWVVTGALSGKPINKELNNIFEIIEIFKEII